MVVAQHPPEDGIPSLQAAQTPQEADKVRNEYRRKLQRAGRADWEAHVTKMTDAIKEAADKGDSKGFWRGVHRVSGKSRANSSHTAPPSASSEELKTIWMEFMSA